MNHPIEETVKNGRTTPQAIEAVGFDEITGEEAVAFYPQRPAEQAELPWLWWTGPVSPEVIEAVFEILDRRSELVHRIVIGGLGGYPICMSQWAIWLVSWSGRSRRCRIIVDTRGLTRRQRQRLVTQTRRRLALSESGDPVAQMVSSVKSWIKERLR